MMTGHRTIRGAGISAQSQPYSTQSDGMIGLVWAGLYTLKYYY